MTSAGALIYGLKKIGDQLTDDWLKKATDDGKGVVATYRK